MNLLSVAAVLAVVAVSVRRVMKALHVVPVMLCSLLGAWVATTFVFPRVHVLVFVVGSLLGGVAVDYGLYLYLQPPLHAGETYADRVRRLLKPLLASALTTVIGFSLLLASDLPLIRHLGVFVSAGIVCALAAALLWFAQVETPYLETRAFIRPRPRRALTPRGRALRAAIGVEAAGGILVGPWRLRWADDIRELEIPAPALQAEAGEVRAQFGDRADHSLYLVRGDTPEAARAALDRFLAWNARTFPGTDAASLGLVLPSPKAWRELPDRLRSLKDFGADLREALARHGFDAEEFAPFLEAWSGLLARAGFPPFGDLARGLATHLRGPLALGMSVEGGACLL